MTYSKTTFVNNSPPAISAAELNKIGQGIEDAGLGYIICTSAARPAAPEEGQAIYETDTDRWLVYDGTNWTRRSGTETDTGSGSSPGTSFAALSTACEIILPAGPWTIIASGYFDFAAGLVTTYSAELWDGSAQRDVAEANVNQNSGQVPFQLMTSLTLAAATTYSVRWKVGTAGGSQLLNSARIIGIPG